MAAGLVVEDMAYLKDMPALPSPFSFMKRTLPNSFCVHGSIVVLVVRRAPQKSQKDGEITDTWCGWRTGKGFFLEM